MLTILYITSVLASFYAPILEDRDDHKKSFEAFAIAITCGILYSIPTIGKICKNIFEPNFWTLFGLFSLVFLNFAFLSNDRANCLCYITAAFLASAVLCFILSNICFSNYLISCNEEHKYTERVLLVTTVDGSEYGESIYGDGFVIEKYTNGNPNVIFYQYYFRAEDGSINSKNIHANHAEITYIDADETPYVEITYKDICKGYWKDSKTHVFSGRSTTYHLYIPKDSIYINTNPAS